MLKYLFIDFDGVITDTEKEVYRLMREWILEHTGHALTLEEYAIAAGAWHVELVNYFQREYQIDLDEMGFTRFCHTLEERALSHLPLMPGVARWLEDAASLGIRCAIVSSNRAQTIHSRLDFLGLRDYFAFILTADDATALKPDPDLYLQALQRAEITPKEALVIEDSMNGVRAAAAAGLRALAVPCSVTIGHAFDDAWWKLDSLEEVSLAEVVERFGQETQESRQK